MPHRSPIPHQLNAARGCVDKSEVQSLWRHRGATPQGLAENMKDTAPGPQARARRARPAAIASALAIVEIHEPEVPEIQGPYDHEPEIQDSEIYEPEIPDQGNPEPDVPEPDVPEPDVPEPDPEHQRSSASN